jgi:DNA-binding MarR family transcriptional regulator
MHMSEATEFDRVQQAQYVSTHLLQHAVLLIRLLSREMGGGLTRTEAGVLRSLADGPRRITELAELEGLAQPTTTLLVKRLEEHNLVRRERQTDDQRVVLVWQTDEGAAALEHFRTLAFAALRVHLDALPDAQLNALAAATDALDELVTTLVRESRVREAGLGIATGAAASRA